MSLEIFSNPVSDDKTLNKTTFVVEIDTQHFGTVESALYMLHNLKFPAVTSIRLIGGETTEDYQPWEPSDYRQAVLKLVKQRSRYDHQQSM